MQGWIKLHRCLMSKPIWTESTPEQKTILITLLMMANHQGREWEFQGQRYTADPGQFVTSLESIATKCGKGITIQNVRTALKRFEKYEFLTNESTNKNRLITIVNWVIYQSSEDEPNKQTNTQLTSNQQATNKQLTTNKNVKNVKNERSNTSRQKYEPSDMELAKLLFTYIQDNGDREVKEPNFDKWANEIRLIRERDGKTHEQIKKAIDWSQNHSFWRTVILSPGKLRSQYTQLSMRAKEESGNNKQKPTNANLNWEDL